MTLLPIDPSPTIEQAVNGGFTVRQEVSLGFAILIVWRLLRETIANSRRFLSSEGHSERRRPEKR
jgi:hypothetical protein